MLQGLYKVRFETPRGTRTGVLVATPGGKLYGGNSGSCFIGSYTETDGEFVQNLQCRGTSTIRTTFRTMPSTT